ncbi:TPA: DNA transposition protein, partial [Vibrio vulnificus]|nr:DNA transposition protein [Vibrio vulnificus]
MTNVIEMTQTQTAQADTRAAIRAIVDNDGVTYSAIARE